MSGLPGRHHHAGDMVQVGVPRDHDAQQTVTHAVPLREQVELMLPYTPPETILQQRNVVPIPPGGELPG
jgi:hypothetical protein